MTYVTSKKARVLAAAVIATVMLLPFGCVAGGAYTEAFPRPFDTVNWKNGEGGEDVVRCGMIADLQYRVGVVGKTRAELNQLLGPADDQDTDPSLSYWLLCPSFMDIWVLEVQWKANRAEASWVRDT
jgi:hypothetical protein